MLSSFVAFHVSAIATAFAMSCGGWTSTDGVDDAQAIRLAATRPGLGHFDDGVGQVRRA